LRASLMSAEILVIEDNAANLELMTYLLRAFGYTVSTAGDGPSGLEAARLRRPEIVICDIELPGMGGYEVVQRLKERPETSGIPVVAVTALAMVGDREKVLSAGFDGYIAKPITPELFVEQVEKFLHADRHSGVSPASRVAPAPAVARQFSPNGPLIAVIDDEAVNISLMQSILEPFGYRLSAAGSVQQGIQLLRQTDPDLIIADIHLPDGTGFDVFEWTRMTESRLRDKPFLFLSATGGRHNEQRAHELGAPMVLVRPIEPEVLLSEIAAALSGAEKHCDANHTCGG
jgi:two-component system, cell cycle response regulator